MNKFSKVVWYGIVPLSAGFMAGTIKGSGSEQYMPYAAREIAMPLCLFGPTVGATLISMIEGSDKNLESKLNTEENKTPKNSSLWCGAKMGTWTMALTMMGYFLGNMFSKLYVES